MKQIAVNNGYFPSVVDKILLEEENQSAISEAYPIERTRCLYESFKNFWVTHHKNKKFFNNRNIATTFKTDNSKYQLQIVAFRFLCTLSILIVSNN